MCAIVFFPLTSMRQWAFLSACSSLSQPLSGERYLQDSCFWSDNHVLEMVGAFERNTFCHMYISILSNFVALEGEF
jgi:hypothetical protein